MADLNDTGGSPPPTARFTNLRKPRIAADAIPEALRMNQISGSARLAVHRARNGTASEKELAQLADAGFEVVTPSADVATVSAAPLALVATAVQPMAPVAVAPTPKASEPSQRSAAEWSRIRQARDDALAEIAADNAAKAKEARQIRADAVWAKARAANARLRGGHFDHHEQKEHAMTIETQAAADTIWARARAKNAALAKGELPPVATATDVHGKPTDGSRKASADDVWARARAHNSGQGSVA